MMNDIDLITVNDVVEAANFIDDNPGNINMSTGYDVIINDKAYPPKEILRIAYKLATGNDIGRILGGNPTNSPLKKLGFAIVDKNQSSETVKANQTVWKLGCNWEKGSPSFYDLINNNRFVIGVKDNPYKIGDLIAIAEGFTVKAIAKVITNPKSIILLSKLKQSFEKLNIPFEDWLTIHQAYWYVLEEKDQFQYQLQAGIRKIQNIEVQNKVRYLWENQFSNQKNNSPFMFLNTILYGPPGTGKTYNTINKALQILGVNIEGMSRKEIKEEFDKRVLAGEIVFTTFHQSMSYEDFIEGIKPKTVGNSDVIYEVEDGIFKRICNKARFVAGNFETVIDKLKQEVSEEDGKTPITIKAAATTFDVRYIGTNVFYVQPHSSTKENAWYSVNINNIRKAFETENYQGLYNPTYIREILKYLTDKFGLRKSNNNNQEQKKYVLIIDEINRGNVSQIFGELITLIEDDKRQGKPEAITVKLPYSKEEFSVPPNLYILGTMNTADRSVEALDTALRRRFMFEEIMPQPEIIQLQFEKDFLTKRVEFHHLKWEDEKWLEIEEDYTDLLNEEELEKFRQVIRDNYKDKMSYKEYYTFWKERSISVKSVEILQTINNRIEVLVNRDNLIGHAFFIGKYTWASLQTVFHKNIIPLLQEYFYGDFGKIGLVLGEGFFKTVQEEYKQSPFAKFGDYDTSVFLEKPKYELKDVSRMEEEEFMEAIQKLLNA